MKFDFDNLRRRIVERYTTCGEFANVIGLSPTQLALRLNNRLPFLSSEIVKISAELDIDGNEIELYFFTPEFDKIELRGRFVI